MKKISLLLIAMTLTLLQGCIGWGINDDDFGGGDFNSYDPVIMQRDAFEATTVLENTPRVIENSGKIYVKDNFIFVNEVNKGFHLINNYDPTNPINIGFVNVLGSSDLSIKGDMFYVNNATDLIAFKIDEANQTLVITKRLENVFPQIWSPEGQSYYQLEANEIIVDWELRNE